MIINSYPFFFSKIFGIEYFTSFVVVVLAFLIAFFFVVFFLKDFFLKIGLIDQKQYQSDRFRVGKVLNPSLRYKRFSVFQKLSDLGTDGEELAELLWDAWKYGRNKVFHYFPGNTKNISMKEAEKTMNTVIKAIIMAGKFLEDTQNHKY